MYDVTTNAFEIYVQYFIVVQMVMACTVFRFFPPVDANTFESDFRLQADGRTYPKKRPERYSIKLGGEEWFTLSTTALALRIRSITVRVALRTCNRVIVIYLRVKIEHDKYTVRC